MELSLFSEISLILAIAMGVGLVLHWFKQPLIIGHILTGIIVGPTMLDVIHHENVWQILSRLGVAVLLFVVGLELSTKVIKRLGQVLAITTVLQVGLVTIIGAAAARLLHFERLDSVIIGLSLAMSSTIVIVKLINDKKEATRLYAQIAIGILLLQDVLLTGGKVALSTLTHESTAEGATILLARGGLALCVMYLIGKQLLPHISRWLESSKEIIFMLALGWGLGWAAVFDHIGLSVEVGALLAGMSLGSLPFRFEMSARLRPTRDFLLVIFFIMLGYALVPLDLTWLMPAIIFSFILIFAKPLIVMLVMGLLGYTKRVSFKTGVAMSQISEFSLILVVSAVASGAISPDVQAVISLTALISIVISTYLVRFDDKIYRRNERRLRLFERRLADFEQREALFTHSIVLFGYRKGGVEFMRTFKKLKKRFVVVDYDPEVIEILESQHVNFLYGDATDPELLEELQLDKCKLVVSTITDREINEYLVHWLEAENPSVIFICSADNAEDAVALYDSGASYVMLPHHIGSEKIGNFLKRNGFKKSEFKKFRQKHLDSLSLPAEPTA